jgi:hypothetical protein
MNMPELSTIKSPRQTQKFPLHRVLRLAGPFLPPKPIACRETREDAAIVGPHRKSKIFQKIFLRPSTDQLGLNGTSCEKSGFLILTGTDAKRWSAKDH